MDRIAIAAFQF